MAHHQFRVKGMRLARKIENYKTTNTKAKIQNNLKTYVFWLFDSECEAVGGKNLAKGGCSNICRKVCRNCLDMEQYRTKFIAPFNSARKSMSSPNRS